MRKKWRFEAKGVRWRWLFARVKRGESMPKFHGLVMEGCGNEATLTAIVPLNIILAFGWGAWAFARCSGNAMTPRVHVAYLQGLAKGKALERRTWEARRDNEAIWMVETAAWAMRKPEMMAMAKGGPAGFVGADEAKALRHEITVLEAELLNARGPLPSPEAAVAEGIEVSDAGVPGVVGE